MDLAQVEKNCLSASRLLKALANEKRLMILCALWTQEMSVGELENKVTLSQSALSQHLARLRQEKLVTTRRDAQSIYYSFKSDAARSVIRALYEAYCPECLKTLRDENNPTPSRSSDR